MNGNSNRIFRGSSCEFYILDKSGERKYGGVLHLYIYQKDSDAAVGTRDGSRVGFFGWGSGRAGFGPGFRPNFPKRNRAQSGSIEGTLANNFFSFGLTITERRTLLFPETVEAIKLLNSAYK